MSFNNAINDELDEKQFNSEEKYIFKKKHENKKKYQ